MHQDTDYDVIIVGAAICGATLMNILADGGLRVLVLDKEQGVLEIPRAAHIDDEVLRYFQHFGVIAALPDAFSRKGPFEFFDNDDRMFLSFPESAERDQGYIDGYYFHQPELEHFLRDRAVGAGVTLLEEHEVIDVSQDERCATVSYRNLTAPASAAVTATAKYVVACDGSSSFVRKHLGIGMEKLAEASRHIIVDFTVHDDVKLPDELGYCVWARIKREGTTIYVHMPKNIIRLEFDVPEDADREQFESRDNVLELLAPWVAEKDIKDIVRASVYTYHSLIADKWLDGRIILAGDAAHLSPPFLGQGACAAIRDVFNLGWKLIRVIKGASPPALLDTYQSERRSHASELVHRAGKIGEMFKVVQFMPEGEQFTAPAVPENELIARPILGPGLHGDAPVPAGELGPQPRLADGRLMDDKVAARFAVVGAPNVIQGMSQQSRDILGQLDAALIEDESDSVTSAIAALGGRVMVVRPDSYLLGVADRPEELDQIVADAAPLLLANGGPGTTRVHIGEAYA